MNRLCFFGIATGTLGIAVVVPLASAVAGTPAAIPATMLTNPCPEPPPTNKPPKCEDAFASPSLLWPPNHKFVGVSIQGVTDPDNDQVEIQITSIAQDEPTNGLGDGDFCPDAIIGANGTASLRSERSGTGDGRIYTISFKATDEKGAQCVGEVTVCVPHDQSPGNNCVESPQSFDSTLCSDS